MKKSKQTKLFKLHAASYVLELLDEAFLKGEVDLSGRKTAVFATATQCWRHTDHTVVFYHLSLRTLMTVRSLLRILQLF